jgi:hypothetical protein
VTAAAALPLALPVPPTADTGWTAKVGPEADSRPPTAEPSSSGPISLARQEQRNVTADIAAACTALTPQSCHLVKVTGAR